MKRLKLLLFLSGISSLCAFAQYKVSYNEEKVPLLCACGKSNDTHTPKESVTGIDGMRIAWDLSTKRQISPRGTYARIKKLSNNTLAAVYELNGSVFSISRDGGNSWETPFCVFPNKKVEISGTSLQINMANPELIQLKNGDLIYAVNYRPAKGGFAPWAIAIKRSSDLGKTWSEARVLYEADCFFENGCWEPAFLQLPDGTLQLYFANESPYRNSGEQNISMMSSHDNGQTWSDAVCVSFRKGKRDGMPVPAIFKEHIVVAIEDNKQGQFKPYTVRSAISDGWEQPVSGDSNDRHSALAEPLKDEVYAGAPYLIKSSTGEAVLSYQSTRYSKNNNMGTAQMEVAIGDRDAKNFSKITYPFGLSWCSNSLWNSLTSLDNHTIAAIASATVNGVSSPWIIKGYIISDLAAPERPIQVDGILSEDEWEGNPDIFIGHRSLTNLKASIAKDKQTLYLGGVIDGVTSDMAPNLNGIIICLDPGNQCLTTPDSGIYKVECMLNGKYKAYEGTGGKWEEMKLRHLSLSFKKGAEPSKYSWEVAIPFDEIPLKGKKTIRLNMGILKKSAQFTYREMIANSEENASYTWCRVNIIP